MPQTNALAALVVARAMASSRDEPERRRPARRRPSARWGRRLRGLVGGRALPAQCADPACVFLAEHYVPDVSAERVDALAARLEAAAATARSEGRDVRFLGFAGLPDDEAFLSLVAAPCSEAAARTVRRADVAADRIVPALWRVGDAG